MKAIPPSIFQFLGVLTNGDAGPYTFYTSSRKRLVVFLKTWPHDPATYNQKLNRDRWRHAAQRWQRLTQETKNLWNQLSFRAHTTVSGYNLFIYYMTNNGADEIQTLQRLTGIDVITPTGPPLPYLCPP